MRVVFLVSSLVLLTGCATKQETAALNATIYDHCVSAAGTSGINPRLKCGSSRATYKPSFSDRYDYFRDQYQAQQQTAQAEQSPREAYARSCYAAGMAAPTRTGDFFESQAKANLAYQQCLQGLPISLPQTPQQPKQTTCMPNGAGGFICTTQ